MKIPEGWRKVALKSIAEFIYGFTETALEKGDVRLIRITDIDDRGFLKETDAKYVNMVNGLKNYFLKKGDILVARTGGTYGKTLYYNNNYPAVFASFLIKIELNKDRMLPEFYFHFSQSDNYWIQAKKLVSGGGQPQFNANILKEIIIPIPPLPEQKAIANILSTWDEAIEKTEKLIKEKEKRFKGLLNDLIHKGRKNNAWKSFILKDICNYISRKNSENNTNVLTSSAQNGLVSQFEYYNKSVSAENVTEYYLLKKGDFAYNRSSAKGYPFGATKRLDRYEKGVLSTLYLCFSLKPNSPCESDFLLHLFESGSLNRELRAVCQEGARSHGLLNITKSDFFGIKIFLPSQNQQKQIQSALNTAQDEINILEKLSEQYKKQKQGLIQKLLTGEWRVKKEIINKNLRV
ncbi:MAG TPA: restriction endonuclease subunit S [bacterium]|nr:restriction endonuclease subunit S [bacterium]HOG42793.1 restriction endonuclease subunit S [bacterium]HPY13693.1 restriction endonuclease subunit S [bacterium]HQB08932.1 restriction endonuclease subunit S [bacterium]HQM84098.1 restriction endonuclease subunit S [bacterium]